MKRSVVTHPAPLSLTTTTTTLLLPLLLQLPPPTPLQDVQSVDLSDNPFHEPSFKFYDQSLMDALDEGDESCEAFFKLLALCHTVMPEEKNGGCAFLSIFSIYFTTAKKMAQGRKKIKCPLSAVKKYKKKGLKGLASL